MKVDLAKEIVTLKNIDVKDITLTGWKLVSVNGNQTYTFPTGYVLKKGATVYITSGPKARNQPPAYLKWTTANIWNNAGDPARLYDAKGLMISEVK
ncbi:lamin tail domain-containing protein [Neobacillus sp. PS3-34]|uniref:lamin tail domain-containing protein n=1 Tax=Neobacillus sp. PS3-34 TaxID=3070678 RepID=UPI0027E1D4E1|nr:lamin tail domain-containing protein [Neobacillus sp. PS3-34]WML48410.1 lamin tail domain-containing protein [Neobacillus sp. PS3-34]